MANFAITTTTVVSSGDGFTLNGFGDTLYIMQGVSLIALDEAAIGVNLAAPRQTLNLAGHVVASRAIVAYADSPLFNIVNITATGAAIGEAVGVEFVSNGQLFNAGLVTGETAVLGHRISNTGQITGSITGVQSNGFLELVNYGTVEGGQAAIVAWGSAEIQNFGVIAGNDYISGGRAYDAVAATFRDEVDTFVNAGLVVGDIHMNGGNDVVDNSAGVVVGTVFLGDGDDRYIGGDRNDTVHAGLGNDEIELGAGNDTVLLIRGVGEKMIDGGAGLDTFGGQGVLAPMVVNLLTGEVRYSGQISTINGFERVNGGNANDTVFGDNLSNIVRGGLGSDALRGNGGNDTIYGGDELPGGDTIWGDSGNDILFGGRGNDRILGGSGDDLLVGGLGVDLMTGATGADRFDFNDVQELRANNSTLIDRITDFEQGLDKIDLTNIDADVSLAGDQAFVFMGTGIIDDPDELAYRHSGGATFIQIGDNTGTGVDVLRLDGIFTLTAADFFL